MEQKYDFVEVTLEPNHYELVKEVYRLHKEQANKIFDLSCGIETNEDILDYIRSKIDNDIVLLAVDKTTDRYAGCLIFDNINMFNGDIISCGVHLVINKKYWGKDSRQIIKDCYKFIKENIKPIKRMECTVPSNNFGIIKLLKDVGFRIEGTMKNRLVFNNRNNVPTLYNELMYSNLNLEDLLNG
jgi:RimJ/RimL family protein N-acetyltransferase